MSTKLAFLVQGNPPIFRATSVGGIGLWQKLSSEQVLNPGHYPCLIVAN